MYYIKKTGWRIVCCFGLIITLFFTCILRIFVINSGEYSEVQKTTNGYNLKLSDLRGTVFDCNMRRITNATTKKVALFMPNESGVAAATELLDKSTAEYVLSSLKNGIPQVAEVKSNIDFYGVYYTDVVVNTASELISPQLIGYLSADGHGVAGVQKSYDSILYSSKSHSLSVEADGMGNVLSGGEIYEIKNESITDSGIMLTLNTDIQEITADAMKNVKCGAAVVTEIGTGKIRAMVSVPEFDACNAAEYLNSENSPFINRAITAYNAGSVFKPCVAIAAIESGFEKYTCSCFGSFEVSGHKFKCHNYAGHGQMDINNALAYSCNVFFYNLALKLGANSVYNTASMLGFGNGYEICKDISCSSQITDIKKLRENSKELVNLSIGQGNLLLSPVSILSLYEAIANNGVYYKQTVIEGTVENGTLVSNEKSYPTRVMSPETAEKIKTFLLSVLEYGTGVGAKPSVTTAAGKTATAETGWLKNGKLAENSWFCGFFPFENPKYAVAVLIEDYSGKDDTASPVFAKIADGITVYENSLK